MSTAATNAPTLEQVLPPMDLSDRPAQFAGHQLAWLDDESAIRVWSKARRIGADYVVAYEAVMDRLKGDRTVDANYISTDHDKTREWVKYCEHFAKLAGIFAEAVLEIELIDDEKVRVYRLTLPCGNGREATIRALTSSIAAARGLDGDIYISELAHHPKPEELWDAAVGCTTLGGRISALSTVGVEGDLHHRLEQMGERRAAGKPLPGDMPVSLHKTTIEDAADPDNGYLDIINRTRGTSFTRDSFLADVRSKCRTDDAHLQEYMCVRSVDAGSYFPRELLNPAIDPAAPEPVNFDVTWVQRRHGATAPAVLDRLMADAARECVGAFLAAIDKHLAGCRALFAGCDIGRKSDRFVIVVRAWRGDRLIVGGYLVMRGAKFAVMRDAGRAVMNHRTKDRHGWVQSMHVDESGLGMQLAEEWADEFRGRIGKVPFTNENKQVLATGGRAILEEGRIALPPGDQVTGSWNKVRKHVTPTGALSYRATSDEAGHADECWADLLCVDAASASKPEAREVHAKGGVTW